MRKFPSRKLHFNWLKVVDLSDWFTKGFATFLILIDFKRQNAFTSQSVKNLLANQMQKLTFTDIPYVFD